MMSARLALLHNAMIAATVVTCTALTIVFLHDASGLWSLVLAINWLTPSHD